MVKEKITFTKKQLEEFLKEESDRNVGEILSLCDSFSVNSLLKNLIKNKIHQNSRTFLGRFIAFICGYNSFEFVFKKPSDSKK